MKVYILWDASGVPSPTFARIGPFCPDEYFETFVENVVREKSSSFRTVALLKRNKK